MKKTKAVIFDLDGTITKPIIDWKKLREEIGVPQSILIMKHIETLRGKEKKKAISILERWEEDAARKSEINDGFLELHRMLKEKSIKTAVVTNNSETCAQIVFNKHGLSFKGLFTRDHGNIKPHGDLLIQALCSFGLDKNECLFIGDGDLDEKAAGKADVPFIRYRSATNNIERREETGMNFFEIMEFLEKEWE